MKEQIERLFEIKLIELYELCFCGEDKEYNFISTNEINKKLSFLLIILHRLDKLIDITPLKNKLSHIMNMISNSRVQSAKDDLEECLICLDNQTKNTMACCDKSVCDDCIVKIRDDNCPFCRKDIRAGNYCKVKY